MTMRITIDYKTAADYARRHNISHPTAKTRMNKEIEDNNLVEVRNEKSQPIGYIEIIEIERVLFSYLTQKTEWKK